MIIRFFTPIVGAVLTLLSFNLSAQGFGVTVDSADAKTGQIVCLPVRALGFTNIISFQYSLTWNQQELTFDHTQNFNLPAWMANDFGANTPGLLLVGWSDIDGQPRTRANGAILYEACFKVIGPLGSSSDITPGTTGFPPGTGGAEAYNANFENVYNPNLNVPGYIEVTLAAGTTDAELLGKPLFQLSPNPTQASSQVLVKSADSGRATLSVTDASGRTLMEQKISLHAGDNTFDIPANVLNAKGMYQVSVKTDKGVTSQMLSVN